LPAVAPGALDIIARLSDAAAARRRTERAAATTFHLIADVPAGPPALTIRSSHVLHF
jgi:hypothetical protein